MTSLSPSHLGDAQDLLLFVEGLRKRFTLHLLGGLEVEPLRGLSFRIFAGDFGVLVGPSGAGKTTVLKCIYRSYLSSGGEIWYRSRPGVWMDLAAAPEQAILQIRKQELAYVTQFLRCAPRVAAEDVVAAPRVAQGVSGEQAREEARALLRRFGVSEGLWRAFPITFSGGEQQRVNLARAVVQRPRLLLLDEPTASLDAGAIGRFQEVLEEIRQDGTTCVAVLHDPELIRTLATQVVRIGPEVDQGRPRDLLVAGEGRG
jgi:alpha-D-ribose 1-methylphosphonate 5-triphosphate synthase subunit PhnL